MICTSAGCLVPEHRAERPGDVERHAPSAVVDRRISSQRSLQSAFLIFYIPATRTYRYKPEPPKTRAMTLAMTFLMLKLTVLSFLAASVAGTGIAIDCITGYRYQGTDQVSSMQPGSACRPRRIRTRTNVEPHASQPHGEHERFDYSEGTEGRGGYCCTHPVCT